MVFGTLESVAPPISNARSSDFVRSRRRLSGQPNRTRLPARVPRIRGRACYGPLTDHAGCATLNSMGEMEHGGRGERAPKADRERVVFGLLRGASLIAVLAGFPRGRDTLDRMDEQSLPCLDILEATPEILRRLMAGVTDADARWKPATERFSIAEVLAHLSHSEGHCYRMRLDRFLSEQRPEFEPDDAKLYLDLYRDADPEDAFDHFEEQRETNIEFIRGLPGSEGSRVALHKEAGEITLAQMLHEWAMHDLGHIRQIAELVRARKYLEGAGPLGASYNLKP